MNLTAVETERLKIQQECDLAKTQKERNRLGQFPTPRILADEILRAGLSFFEGKRSISFLDPAFGTGAFYSSLLRFAPSQRVERALGFEIDPLYGTPAKGLWKKQGLDLRIADFTSAEPPENTRGKFNFLVCNPPYVRHHHLDAEQKARLSSKVAASAGVELNGLTGLYCYFLLLCDAWMEPGGISVWLIPSEFMDVNYGRRIKDYLLRKVTLLRVHRFDPNEVQFQDALVSSAVLIFRHDPPPTGHRVKFTFGGKLNAPSDGCHIDLSHLTPEQKWTRYPRYQPPSQKNGALTLGDLFTIRRGLATGANHFFILPREQAASLGLPEEFLRPILPSPRYLESDEIQGGQDGHPRLKNPLVLLDCPLPPDTVRRKYPRLWSYLEKGIGEGVQTGYLCSGREPWYSQEKRLPPPFLCTYIGRSDNAERPPFRFIHNLSNATAANVYLLLYPKPILESYLAGDWAKARGFWKLLNSISSEHMLSEGRVYGGGLHKLEPRELSNVHVPSAITKLLPSPDRVSPPKKETRKSPDYMQAALL
jgi:adenine-specific DNA-methyltransferase